MQMHGYVRAGLRAAVQAPSISIVARRLDAARRVDVRAATGPTGVRAELAKLAHVMRSDGQPGCAPIVAALFEVTVATALT